MLISDIYKVIDDGTPYIIFSTSHDYSSIFKGNDWGKLPESVFDWRVTGMSVGTKGTLFIKGE